MSLCHLNLLQLVQLCLGNKAFFFFFGLWPLVECDDNTNDGSRY